MSQQSLASKTITKRNVAQSSVIFSVVVAVITLGVIATVAYVDITEEISTASTEKSIPQLIAEQKLKSKENRIHVELVSQSEDFVLAMDDGVDSLKQLEQKVTKANNQLNFVTTQLQSNAQNTPQSILSPIKTVQTVNEAQKNNTDAGHYLNSIFDQNHAFKMKSSFQSAAAGEAFFQISWWFKARGKSGIEQEFLFNQQLSSQNNWKANII